MELEHTHTHEDGRMRSHIRPKVIIVQCPEVKWCLQLCIWDAIFRNGSNARKWSNSFDSMNSVSIVVCLKRHFLKKYPIYSIKSKTNEIYCCAHGNFPAWNGTKRKRSTISSHTDEDILLSFIPLAFSVPEPATHTFVSLYPRYRDVAVANNSVWLECCRLSIYLQLRNVLVVKCNIFLYIFIRLHCVVVVKTLVSMQTSMQPKVNAQPNSAM